MIEASPLLTDDDGAGVIEYALLAAIVSLGLIVSLRTVAPSFCGLSTRVAELLGSSAPGCAGNPGGSGRGGGNNGNGVGNTGPGNQGNDGSNGNAGGGGGSGGG